MKLTSGAFFKEAAELKWADRLPAHDVIWEGQPMRAVRLPYHDAAVASEPATADEQAPPAPNQAAFLLVPPAFWEEMSTIAQELIAQHQREVTAMRARSGATPAQEPSEQPE